MKSKLIILSTIVLVFSAGQVFAEEGHDHGAHEDSTHMEEISSDAVNVGNTICPVSGEQISGVGDGKGVQNEYEGKIYNTCCKFCAKDFKKNPEKFIKIIEKNLAEGTDPGMDQTSDHDDTDHDH